MTVATGPGWELRLGRWQDVLGDVEADAVITDPPYSERTHSGHDDGGTDGSQRRALSYLRWGAPEIDEFAARWCGVFGWTVALSDSVLTEQWRLVFESRGRTGFQPLPCVIRGMTVRLAGDGPSSWAFYANVSRPKILFKWGTLPGAYILPPGYKEIRAFVVGGKPLWLMRALVRDYSRPGDLIVDPCAGSGTTLLAAAIEGRRAIGAEMDPETFELARKRLERGFTPSMFESTQRKSEKPVAESMTQESMDFDQSGA